MVMPLVSQRKVEKPAVEEVARAVEDIMGVAQGRLGPEVFPLAMRVIHRLGHSLIGGVIIAEGERPKRPRLATLLPACMSLAQAKANPAYSGRLNNVEADPRELHMAGSLIQRAREMIDEDATALSNDVDSATLMEVALEMVLESAFEVVEPLMAKDRNLRRDLEPLRLHIKGAAEQAADTARENRELRKEAREQGRKEGAEQARKELRGSAMGPGDFRGLAARLNGLAEAMDESTK
jgi:hypothetical protein